MTQHNEDKEIAKLSFEAALQELEHIVQKLEQGNVPLEESIAIYERGELLKKHCDTLLKAAEDKVQKIRLNNEGAAVGVEEFDKDLVPF